MTPADWSDPLRAEAMRHCTEGRGPLTELPVLSVAATLRLVGAMAFLCFVAGFMIVALV